MRKLSRTGSSRALPSKFAEWQFIQVLVGGIPANEDFSTEVVAIAAVNAQPADMVLMAKGNRLRPHHFGVSDVGRPLQFEQCPQQGRDQKYCPVNRGTGDCVRTAMKNLHRLSVQQGCRTPSRVQYGAVRSKQSQKAVMSHMKTRDYSSSRLIVIEQQFNSSKNQDYRTRKSMSKILTKSQRLRSTSKVLLRPDTSDETNGLTAGSSRATLVQSCPRSHTASLHAPIPIP